MENRTLKDKLLVVLLAGSLLVNIAGVVFFILFLGQSRNLRNVKRDKVALERQLAVARSATVIGDAVVADKILRRTFASHSDGQMDNYAFQPPSYLSGTLDYTLVVYLHGMGSNYLEPFVSPVGTPISAAVMQAAPGIGILSCNYRKDAAWGSDTATGDIAQNIRLIMQEYPFSRIVVMGTSMGACVSLNFAATAPTDIQQKIVGVVAIEGAGDLGKLYYQTANKSIAPAMIMAFGGRPDQIPDVYKKKSFLNNLANVPPAMRFYILGARQDRIVPFAFQEEICRQLQESNRPFKLEAIDGNHQVPEASYYAGGLKYVVSASGS